MRSKFGTRIRLRCGFDAANWAVQCSLTWEKRVKIEAWSQELESRAADAVRGHAAYEGWRGF